MALKNSILVLLVEMTLCGTCVGAGDGAGVVHIYFIESVALKFYDSGSDTIKLTRPGHYYFLCGALGHCGHGQKVGVMVSLPIPDSSASSPSPAPSGLSSPSSPAGPISSPSPAPSGMSSPSTPHPPEERPPHSAALTINAPKLALTLGFVLVFYKLMF
ncbi:uclacyanin-3-like [Argentina anserina]|uniref:uclacyanin-3-like n=1 Tax=Argentina anserina TaxID=57926 RepID=UPI0021763B35|nr:uclacyanin-3-like [Potentilla anserina]